jgi:hypothetical protein
MTTTKRLLWGAAAGAAGTTALNAVTYADMLLRGRAPSGVPAKAAGIIAGQLGIHSLAVDNDTPAAEHRREAAGAMLGYLVGAGMGIAHATIAPKGDSLLRDGIALGLAAMAASDGPIVLTGASDPTTWGISGWLSDAIPHLAYGLVTAAVLHNRPRRP